MKKFSDIPQFTSMGEYHVNVALTEIPHVIERYIKTHSLEMNPDFQRGHIWTQEQQIRYIEFMLSGGCSGKDIFFNHPGWQRDFSGCMVLVDGLQRLTAAQAFMGNKIPAYGAFYQKYDRIHYSIDFIFHVNCLKTKAEVLKWYIELNEGGVVHTPAEIKRVRQLLEEEKSK